MRAGSKIVAGLVLLLAAAGLGSAALLLMLDVHGIRRGCLAPKPDEARYESARALYQRAGQAAVSRNHASANEILDMALSRLGEDYKVGYHVDGGDEAVAAGKAAAARGEFEAAAQMKMQAMDRRLGLFERRMRLHSLCRDYVRRFIH